MPYQLPPLCYPQSIHISIHPSIRIFICQSINEPLPFPKYQYIMAQTWEPVSVLLLLDFLFQKLVQPLSFFELSLDFILSFFLLFSVTISIILLYMSTILCLPTQAYLCQPTIIYLPVPIPKYQYIIATDLGWSCYHEKEVCRAKELGSENRKKVKNNFIDNFLPDKSCIFGAIPQFPTDLKSFQQFSLSQDLQFPEKRIRA